ncbi:MAG: N-acetylmuramoyl-L-alanine amidase [Peptococcaceae bacterium]|nr:N-acetylmuramoyl-L-alanine amidase [Peptococcaceae bacterium]
MRSRLVQIGLAVISAVLLIGCGRQSIPAVAMGVNLGQALRSQGGYYVPLATTAATIMARVVVDASNGTIEMIYDDGFRSMYSTDDEKFIISDGLAYVELHAVPALLGLAGSVSNQALSLEFVRPNLTVHLTDQGLTLDATSAISYQGTWSDDGHYELVVPGAAVVGDTDKSLDISYSAFTQVNVGVRSGDLYITFSGSRVAGYEPSVYFNSGRTSAIIDWPRPLDAPISVSESGRNTLGLVVPEGRVVVVLPEPEIKSTPTVRLRRRADLRAGPSTYFPVAKAGVSSGSEGTMLEHTPGWVKASVQGYEGWFRDVEVSISVKSPNFPLTLRSSIRLTSDVVGVIAANADIVLREKVDGGYLVSVPGQDMQGYMLDGQLFLDKLLYYRPRGLTNVIRFAIMGSLPPAEIHTVYSIFQIADIVVHEGSTIFTVSVPTLMNLHLEQQGPSLSIAAGIVLDSVDITEVASGQQLAFNVDGAHELYVSRTLTGLIITLPYASLSSSFMQPSPTGAITAITVVQQAGGVELAVTLQSPLAYRIYDSRLVTVMSSHIAGKTIVIDPGHGGRDPGAIGKLGWNEKDYTLDIALLLASELKRMGALPILTHEGIAPEKKVMNEERLLIINQLQNDLFVSIHLNAFSMSSLGGAETYYRNSEENLRLARLLQNGMANAGLRNRRVIDNQTLALLRRGQPPGVLLEVAYITNPDDERLLKDVNRRKKLAAELAEAIEAFFASHK